MADAAPAIDALFGKKIGMTRFYRADGKSVAVTAIEVGPCTVVQVKKQDGAAKLQLAFDPLDNERALQRFKQQGGIRKEIKDLEAKLEKEADPKKIRDLQHDIRQKRGQVTPIRSWTKPELGHYHAAGVLPHRFLGEVQCKAPEQFKLGDQLTVDVFERLGIHFVHVTGWTKGRGFAGVVKRWRFEGGPATHGQSDRERAPGSIGRQGSISRNVVKNKKMGGHYGDERVTIRNLEIEKILKDKNVLLVKGAIPGPNGGYVVVSASYRKAKGSATTLKKKAAGGKEIIIKKK